MVDRLSSRIARRVIVAGAALALGAARAEEPTAPVLLPSAAGALERAIKGLAPPWRYDDIRLERDHVVVHACAAPAPPTPSCFTARLDAASAGCIGRAAGPFCLRFTGGGTAEAGEAMATAMRDVDGAAVWSRPAPEAHDPDAPPAEAPRPGLVFLVCLALVVVPAAAGALAGGALRRLRRKRLAGSAAAAACVVVPALAAVALGVRWPVVGIWDAALVGLTAGVGLVFAAHRALAGWQEKLVALAALVLCLLGLEAATRALLPRPPAFPVGATPHLGLADALRADARAAPSEARNKDIVCQVVYGDGYPGLYDGPGDPRLVLPARYRPRAGATRRVLHVGDSMVFGFGVAARDTFVAELGRLEPGVEHTNGGVPALAPDGYLALTRAWLAAARPDAVVIYLFEGNDLRDLDGPYPCCGFRPLVDDERPGAPLTCPTAVVPDLGRAGWTWLRYNSPPPYLVRALVDHSVAAAWVGAALITAGQAHSAGGGGSPATQLRHLSTIVAAARDELAARGVALSVVVLPMRGWVEARDARPHPAPEMAAAVRALGVPVLDASDVLREPARHGEHLFVGDGSDVHLNSAGHALVARWLHAMLAAPPP